MGGKHLPFMPFFTSINIPKRMKAYTSYPLDSNSGVTEIEVLSYDRNKYCRIICNAIQYEIKRGYIWKDFALTKSFSKIQWYLLPTEPLGSKPTRRQAYREMKHDKHKKQTKYMLSYGDSTKEFKNLNDALTAFARLNQDSWLVRFTSKGYSFTSSPILERVNGWLFIITCGKESCLKINHLNKYKIENFKGI